MWHAAISALFDLILPRHLRAARAIAVSEAELASFLEPRQLSTMPWVHTLFPYRNEKVRAIVQAVKYYGERAVAKKVAPFAADVLTELLDQKIRFEGWESILLVPIPSSPKRTRERGYTQAALFTRAIAELVPDIAYDEKLLTREERTSQVHVPRSKRKSNMSLAFHAEDRTHGHFIILIDDVVESGATLSDARRALLAAGARGVIALALAH